GFVGAARSPRVLRRPDVFHDANDGPGRLLVELRPGRTGRDLGPAAALTRVPRGRSLPRQRFTAASRVRNAHDCDSEWRFSQGAHPPTSTPRGTIAFFDRSAVRSRWHRPCLGASAMSTSSRLLVIVSALAAAAGGAGCSTARSALPPDAHVE